MQIFHQVLCALLYDLKNVVLNEVFIRFVWPHDLGAPHDWEFNVLSIVRLLYLLAPHSFEKVKTKFGQVAIFLSLLKAVVEKKQSCSGFSISPICSYHRPALSSDSLYYSLLIVPSEETFIKKEVFSSFKDISHLMLLENSYRTLEDPVSLTTISETLQAQSNNFHR